MNMHIDHLESDPVLFVLLAAEYKPSKTGQTLVPQVESQVKADNAQTKQKHSDYLSDSWQAKE